MVKKPFKASYKFWNVFTTPLLFFQKGYAVLIKIPITQREKSKVWKGSKQREHRSGE